MRKVLLTVVCMMMLCWIVPSVSVQAAEGWEYEYSGVVNYKPRGNVYSDVESFTFRTHYPIYGYIKSDNVIYACLVPDGDFENDFETEILRVVNDGNMQLNPNAQVVFLTSEVWLSDLKSDNSFSFKGAFFNTFNDYTVTFPVFSSAASLADYLETGDDSGWVNKPEEIKLENFSLLDFTCDNSIRAEWKGITGTEEIPSIDDIKVLIHPSYFTILEDNEPEQQWSQPDDIEIPFMNFGFYNAYSNYFENYPYKNGRLILDFTPICRSQKEVYKGQTVSVYFDMDGNISSLNYPAASLKSVYDDDFYFNGMLVTEDNYKVGATNAGLYKKINFMWSGTSIDNIVDYYYSDIKVQIKVRVGQKGSSYGLCWVDYPLNDIVSIIDNRLSIDMKDVQAYVKSLGQDYRVYDDDFTTNYGFKDVCIRLVPYYKTYNTYCYGHAVEYRLNSNLGGELFFANGDIFSNDAIDYSKVHDSYYDNNNILDDLFKNSDDSGELDFTFLTDVIKNFFAGIIDFFKYAGAFPGLIKDVLSFMPSYYFQLITYSFVIVFILRILGR